MAKTAQRLKRATAACKRDIPVEQARRYLESGPVVLVSSRWRGRDNIMTIGWHTMMEFSPSLVGCVIASSNDSFEMIRRSGECAINIPDAGMLDQVVAIGNSDGHDVDKFNAFGLTRVSAVKIDAPLIRECFANFECRIHDRRLINRYNFFILEIVKAEATGGVSTFPKTLHYRGRGQFTTDDGRATSRARQFTKLRHSPTF